ncbi:CSH1 [Candida oxycetoniae]|uniref:inositol phosphorylceramide mannosyltransferase n=1 Tax=Candida oxycetoniae TaxID=497107 RepID=A0AAI9T0L6_9ASCO|nr:CSH1 [Candida oxycetoniae]KAI3406227.2 CSH1 [Candida oxycetoniae]
MRLCIIDALMDFELNPPENDGLANKSALIPKIIHQTYKSDKIPEIWKAGQQACIDLHEGYQYILWTDEMAREFISEEFPWFLKTWDNYRYNIQRADAIRYFALYHYGGIYIDLDDGCERRLDPLLTVSAFVRKTMPTGISNDVMGSVPNHPFFLKVIESLEKYQRSWLVPYITIMISTGPLFLSVIWKQYKRWGVPEAGKIRILMPENYKGYKYSFFAIAPGSSWHMSDANFIKSLANHLVLAIIGGFLIALAILALEYLFYSFIISAFFKKLTGRIANFFMWIITGILRFFNLDKFIESNQTMRQYRLLNEPGLTNTTIEKNLEQGDVSGGENDNENNNDDDDNDVEESLGGTIDNKKKRRKTAGSKTTKMKGINIMQYLKKNPTIKRRSRKDSNLPFDIEMMEKLIAQDNSVVVADKDSNKELFTSECFQVSSGDDASCSDRSINAEADVAAEDADISTNDEFNDEYNDNIV